jgi:hypothetical protein
MYSEHKAQIESMEQKGRSPSQWQRGKELLSAANTKSLPVPS